MEAFTLNGQLHLYLTRDNILLLSLRRQKFRERLLKNIFLKKATLNHSPRSTQVSQGPMQKIALRVMKSKLFSDLVTLQSIRVSQISIQLSRLQS